MASYGSDVQAADIAFLGPEGTYCDQAAQAFARRLNIHDGTFLPRNTFSEVFDAVEDGLCEFGVVALENSIEGPVTATLDSFASRNSTTIVGEEVVDIAHSLLLAPGTSLHEIRTVASHPQALAQCRDFLTRNFAAAEIRPVNSTASAALLAAQDHTVAAIANERTAELSGLEVAFRGIEDHAGDQTNFALIALSGHDPVFAPGSAMKTSLALYLHDDRPGALQMILSEFAYGGINLTKIQSRPTKRRLGEYMFFIDIEGSADDEPIRIALDCLRLKLRSVRVLGSYPRAASDD